MLQTLPIKEIIPDIKELLNRHNRLVLQAPPGAGKTTSVPINLLNESWLSGKKIIMLEPRRIAARNAAYWMAKSLGEFVGETIGYSVHLDRKVSDKTVIEVVTEGVFVNRLLNNPELADVALVIFDEFHERSLDADLSLSLLRDCQEVLRDDIKLLVMSATLDSEPVAQFLDRAPIITSKGKSYPVDLKYVTNGDDNVIKNTVSAVIDALNSEDGSLLVFLPGVGEIKRVESELKSRTPEDILIQPLYGALSREEQERAIEPVKDGLRKVVLATSIAESSITIKGIRVVIDSGLIRKPRYSHKSGLDTLETQYVSLASADQRMGRAGRTESGVCFRLWDRARKLDDFTEPGIVCEDLTNLVLYLYKWGYKDINDLEWLTAPNRHVFNSSLELLKSIGAIDDNGLTKHGDKLSKISLHPRLGNMVIKGEEADLKSLACDLSAILSERDILNYNREDFQSDVLLRLEALSGKKVFNCKSDRNSIVRVKGFSKSLCRSSDRNYDIGEAASLLISAYPDRIAKMIRPGLYQMVNGQNVQLPDSDSLYGSDFLIIPALGGLGRELKASLAASITKEDIFKECSNNISREEKLIFNETKNKFSCIMVHKLGHLELKKESVSSIDDSKFSDTLCNYLRENGLKDLNWKKDSLKFKDRICFLYSQDDSIFPDFSDEGLLKDLTWLKNYLGGITIKNSLKDIPLFDALKGFFSFQELSEIDRLAPTHYTVPSGSKIPIDYTSEGPILRVRLQELFGLNKTPSIFNDNIPVTIHLLSPASRPIQITKDLKSFWDNTYTEVKKDLKGRYPKHYWPDDPYDAKATSRVKRKS